MTDWLTYWLTVWLAGWDGMGWMDGWGGWMAVCLSGWLPGWLAGWLTDCLLMPSDKCKSITAKAAPKLALWFYQSLPLFPFVLHSFLQCHVGGNLQYVHYGFSVRLGGKCGAGQFLHYSLLGLLPKVFKELEVKWSVEMHSDQVTHPPLNQQLGHAKTLTIKNFVFSIMTELNGEMLFNAVLCL